MVQTTTVPFFATGFAKAFLLPGERSPGPGGCSQIALSRLVFIFVFVPHGAAFGQVWDAKNCVVIKRSMATGYAGLDNPVFYKVGGWCVDVG